MKKNNKKNNCLRGSFLLILFLAVCANDVSAQVGMTGNNPDKSAALDLNATDKGVLISSFNLSSTTDVSSIAGGVPANSLLVFNNFAGITGTGAAGTGYYYWDATAGLWKKLAGIGDVERAGWSTTGNTGTSPSVNFVGTTTNKDLSIRTANLEVMRITANGNVGVSNDLATNKLDVKGSTRTTGKMYIGNAPVAPKNGVSPLVRDQNTGQVFALTTGNNTKPYNYVKYTLTNMDGDWVSAFDTKIPKSLYTVVIVGNAFKLPENVGMQSLYEEPNKFNVQNVYAFVGDNDTWYLSADYDGGGPTVEGINGTWDIYCLVINNASLATLTEQTTNLGGNNSGSASVTPAGL